MGARFDELAAQHSSHCVVVVRDFERAEAVAAYPTGGRRVRCTTQVTGQPGHELHTELLATPGSSTLEPCSSTESVRTVASTPARSYIVARRPATCVES